MNLTITPLALPTAQRRPIVFAGPCSAETEEQTLATAHALSASGSTIFRVGLWKPRTHAGQFEGRGAAALPWLQRVKEETGMAVATEVATAEHVEQCLKYGIDILWLGARTTADPFAVQSIAEALRGEDIPVLVKNPINPDIELWIGALERLSSAGITRLAAVHRGFFSYGERLYRNSPLWAIPIELHRRYPQLPLFCDPSHIGGQRTLVAPLCQQAMDLGYDGLFVEVHCTPDAAWSDGKQQITPAVLSDILAHLVIRSTTNSATDIDVLRATIDRLDEQLITLLSQRLSVCRDMGQYKKEHNMTVLQAQRFSDLIHRCCQRGTECGLPAAFTKQLFDLIHAESVRQQMIIVDGTP